MQIYFPYLKDAHNCVFIIIVFYNVNYKLCSHKQYLVARGMKIQVIILSSWLYTLVKLALFMVLFYKKNWY